MKRTTYIISIFGALAMLLSACSDFLDREPWDSVDTSEGFQTAEDAVAAVNAAYQPLQWAKLYNMRIWTLDIMAGNSVVGAGGGTDGIETVDLANFIATADNFAALDLWRGPSPGILRCNFVLQNVPGMDMDQKLKNRCLGEAYFLRAHYYFILVRLFGGVPYIITPQTSETNLLVERAPVSKIYELITSDLKNAISLLPKKSEYSTTDLGRATREAAMAELIRVYMTYEPSNDKYEEVVRMCDEIGSMGYELASDYSDIFDPAKKNGVELQYLISGKSNKGQNEKKS